MKILREKYRQCFSNKRYIASLLVAGVLLIAGLIINYYAGRYATLEASNSVNDLVLSNTPVFDVDAIFVYGPFVVWLLVIYLGLRDPRKIPFVLKTVALFIFIRSVFVTLTHIGPFPDHIIIVTSSHIINNVTFGGDLFFSGHTGLPFLFALIFYKNMPLRIFFVASSIFFGIIVLLAHLHYSIDVLSAFFITYTIYHLARFMFKEDERMFNDGVMLT